MEPETLALRKLQRIWGGGVELLHARHLRQSFPRHTHEGYAVGVIEGSALGFFYRGENVVAAPGHINLCVPGEVHTGQPATPEGWSYRMFYFDAHVLREGARALHRQLGIRIQGWSPLGLGGQATLAAEPVTGAARRHGATPAQVVLRWHQQLGSLPIPRSSDSARQRENLQLGHLQLDEDELQAITALGRSGGRLWGGDPETEER